MKQQDISYLFKTFLKIGAVSWGGHLSLVSMARKKLVEEDKVLTDDLVVESLSLASILPGPVAVNIVSYWGYKMHGWKGALISAIAILLPAFIGLLLLSYLYFKYAHIVVFKTFFLGIMPAVAAIIFTTGVSMVQKQKLDYAQYLILLVSATLFFFIKGYWTSLVLILLGAVIGIWCYKRKLPTAITEKPTDSYKNFFVPLAVCFLGAILVYALSSPILKPLEKQFVFISLSQVGGGYVVIPSMEKIFVDSLHWLTHQEFVDGIALSQITPGPIFIIAEFVGYRMDGIIGSIVATVAVYTPSAILLIAVGSLFRRVQNSILIKAAFKGIHPVVTGMIFSAAIGILTKEQTPVTAFLLFILAIFLLLKTKIAAPLILLGCGILGLLLY